MAFGTRIRLPQALDENIWLKDFGRVVDNFAASFTDSYTMDLVRGKEGHTYTQVAREFRRWYSTKSYGAKGKKQSTMRGGAFAAQFGKEEAEPQGDGPEKGRKRQRALTATDLKPRKKKCPACEGPHAIADCWIVIESKRPDGWIPSQRKVERLEKKLQERKSLTRLIEEAKKQAVADEA